MLFCSYQPFQFPDLEGSGEITLSLEASQRAERVYRDLLLKNAVARRMTMVARRASMVKRSNLKSQPGMLTEAIIEEAVEDTETDGSKFSQGAILFRGFLTKLGRRRKNWKRRFFELSSAGCLTYYKVCKTAACACVWMCVWMCVCVSVSVSGCLYLYICFCHLSRPKPCFPQHTCTHTHAHTHMHTPCPLFPARCLQVSGPRQEMGFLDLRKCLCVLPGGRCPINFYQNANPNLCFGIYVQNRQVCACASVSVSVLHSMNYQASSSPSFQLSFLFAF